MKRPRAVRVLRSLSSSARARADHCSRLVPAICRKSSSRLGCSVRSSWRATPWVWASVADLGGGGPAHRQGVVQAVDGRAGGDERGLQLLGLRRADAHHRLRRRGQLLDGPLREQPALAHDEHVVDGLLDLGEHVAGDEDRAALAACLRRNVRSQQHPFRVEAVGRLVEDEHLGVAEQGRGERQALSHARGVALDRPFGRALQLDELERLVHARVGDAGAGGDHAQRVAPGAAGVEAGGVEERADPGGGRAQLAVPAAEDGHRAGRRAHEVEDHAQRGRLAGTIGAEDAGDGAFLDGEAHVVDGEDLLAEALGEVIGLDDGHRPSRMACARRAPAGSLHEDRGALARGGGRQGRSVGSVTGEAPAGTAPTGRRGRPPSTRFRRR